jgi:hypothetical protein
LLVDSSGEIEVIGPIDAEFLIVVCAAQAKINLRSTGEFVVRQEEAPVDLFAIDSVCIDFAFGVDSSQ